MMSSKASRRYASALLGFAIETDSLDTVRGDMEFTQKTISKSRELLLFLKSPVIRDEKKQSVLSEIFKSRVSKQTWKFFELLAGKSRLELLPDISHAFKQAYNKHAGIIEVDIIYSAEPETGQIETIRKTLEKQTGNTVHISTRRSEELIGGMVIKIEDTVVDGSVKNKLQQLEQLFYKAAI